MKIKLERPIRYEWFEGIKHEFEFIMREDWFAKEPLYEDHYNSVQADVLINYTDTEECDNIHDCIEACLKLQSDHMAAGEPDIKQNFLVGGSGHIFEGRGYWTKPPFDPKWPDISNNMINIAYIGKRNMFPKKGMVLRALEFIHVSTQEPGHPCLQPNVGIYLDYFDDDFKMTDEVYNYMMAREDNELDEGEFPSELKTSDRPPWDKRECWQKK